jgi:predicted Zn-dependent peptidase
MSSIHRHHYDNDLTLLIEPIEGVASVGMTLLVPAGVVHEPADRNGIAEVVAQMVQRGAGQRDSKTLTDALDRLGVHRTVEVQTCHTRLGATLKADRLPDALPLLVDIIRRPLLQAAELPPCVQLAVQAVESLDDDPQQKVMLELRKLHQPDPIGRSLMGQITSLQQITAEEARDFHRRRFVPRGAIIALAGAVDPARLQPLVDRLLGDWEGTADLTIHPAPLRPGRNRHLHADAAQQHIGLAYDTVGESSEQCMLQRLAVAVLSGGMSGRLFTEVRENRGLCYSVYASYWALRDRGTVYAYAGSTPQRAAETLAVLRQELVRLSDGVQPDEFARAVVGLKSRLVMQGESTSARAASIAADQFLLGSPRTLEELAAQIDAVKLDDLNRFVRQHRPTVMTCLTIGPEKL